MSQPFTIFDQLLLSLDRKVSEVARSLRPEKNDFRPSQRGSPEASSFVSYDESMARTVVEFDLTVSGIDDAWREVCAKHVNDIVTFGLQLPYSEQWKTGEYNITGLGFFSEFLGPQLTSNATELRNYKAFSDSIVVKLQFAVENDDKKKPLKLLRICFFDNKTNLVSFYEHKY